MTTQMMIGKPTYEMKKLILLILISFICACSSLSKKQLAEQVEQMIIETYNETPGLEQTEVVDLRLDKKDGDKYKGVLTVKVPNLFGNMMNSFNGESSFEDKTKITYDIEVLYDGVDIDWQIVD